ncbi:MAG: phytase, partial [Pseudomonadota bacterium]|nr:phytase [Pseudomonadota bacterium]
EGYKMLDNLTIDRLGRLLIQEDVGDDARLGKIWLYLIDTGHFIEVAQHNPRFFLNHGQAEFITQDEESSGIIEAEGILGKGWFLLDVQAHKAHPETALVEFGQVLAMFVDPRLDKEVK